MNSNSMANLTMSSDQRSNLKDARIRAVNSYVINGGELTVRKVYNIWRDRGLIGKMESYCQKTLAKRLRIYGFSVKMGVVRTGSEKARPCNRKAPITYNPTWWEKLHHKVSATLWESAL